MSNAPSRSEIRLYELDDQPLEIAGSVGDFGMVDISELRVDPAYQREITAAGVRNVQHIAKNFDWRQFSPIIGVLNDDGTVSIIDGQHRASAAKARGIQRVPVYFIKATVDQAAAAFAAINGQVTAVKAQAIFRARLASGDKIAAELQRVCDTAGVKIVPTNYSTLRKGETASVKSLQRAFKLYGPDLLGLVLQCITETADGNPGLITGPIIHGIANALLNKIDVVQKPSELFELFDDIDLRDILDEARLEALRTKNAVQNIITREINRHIRERFDRSTPALPVVLGVAV